MSFVDRLLQRRKIVTKVLLFVVPLVLLIAGVGMAGFYTAETLNGHMTVTRATIENIGDFEDLQSSLQAFTEAPSDQTVATLRSSIARQADGVGILRARGVVGRGSGGRGDGESETEEEDPGHGPTILHWPRGERRLTKMRLRSRRCSGGPKIGQL